LSFFHCGITIYKPHNLFTSLIVPFPLPLMEFKLPKTKDHCCIPSTQHIVEISNYLMMESI
jgi:hypothetical protein